VTARWGAAGFDGCGEAAGEGARIDAVLSGNLMRVRLILIFVLLPFADLASLAWLSWQTHWVIAMGLVLAAGIGGAYLVRWRGPRQLKLASQRIARREAPADELLDAAFIFLAGVLLISPGMLSDLAALALLFPPTRRLIRLHISRSIHTRIIRSVSAMADYDGDDEVPVGAVVDVAPPFGTLEETEERGRGTGRGVYTPRGRE